MRLAFLKRTFFGLLAIFAASWGGPAFASSPLPYPHLVLIRVISTAYTINDIAFSPDDSQLVCGGWNDIMSDQYDGITNMYAQHGMLFRWSVRTGALLQCSHTASPLMAVAYSPNGKLLATGYGGTVCISNAVGGATIHRVIIDSPGLPTGVEDLAFSPDSRILAVGTVEALDHSEPGPLLLVDVKTGMLIGKRKAGIFADLQTVQAKAGNRLQWFGVASRTATVMYCCNGTQADDHGRPLYQTGLFLEHFQDNVRHMHLMHAFNDDEFATSADGKFVAGSTDGMGNLDLWFLPSGKCIQSATADTGPYQKIAISADGEFVAFGTANKIYVWQIEK